MDVALQWKIIFDNKTPKIMMNKKFLRGKSRKL